MADETKVEAQAAAEAAAEAPAKVAETVAATVDTVVKESAKAAKRTRTATARRVKRDAVAQKTVAKAATRRTARKSPTAARKSPTAARKSPTAARKSPAAARKTAAAAQERTTTVTKNIFTGVDAIPAFAPFQNILTEANERSQDLVKRSQKVAGELADLARANVEAVVEAGRVASEGARSIGQEVVAKQRDSFEQAADAIRSLAEAKSPTEYLQLQSDFARASFDRAVAESSKLTESLVKLAGQAFQPLSNRASANAERFNTLVA
jgi:phasin family protein